MSRINGIIVQKVPQGASPHTVEVFDNILQNRVPEGYIGITTPFDIELIEAYVKDEKDN